MAGQTRQEGSPTVQIRERRLIAPVPVGGYRAGMRLLDLLLSALGLVVTLPLLLVAVIAIRLETPGGAIFAQPRIGRNRRVFVCYKLRTMRKGTPQGASHEVGAAGTTRVGRFLRKTKLDEIPQLWNVIKGDMSLVGPRPCLPTQTELASERDKYGLHAIRPGITGPSQIAGVDMSVPAKLAALDATWLRERSLWAYVRIVLMTVVGRGRGDAAAMPESL